jgi:hypothetical protein
LTHFAYRVLKFGKMASSQRARTDGLCHDLHAVDVGATEDLMREHGVLNRILLIYEEGLRRLRAKEDVPPSVFHKPALFWSA